MKVILSVPDEGYYERTWWRLFQKRIVRTKLDIYVFIIYSSTQLSKIQDGPHWMTRVNIGPHELKWKPQNTTLTGKKQGAAQECLPNGHLQCLIFVLIRNPRYVA